MPNEERPQAVAPVVSVYPKSIWKRIAGFLLSFVLAFVSLVIANAFLITYPILTAVTPGIPMPYALTLIALFLVLNSLLFFLLSLLHAYNLKRGVLWGYLFILLLFLLSRPVDNAVNVRNGYMRHAYTLVNAAATGDITACTGIEGVTDDEINQCLDGISRMRPTDMSVCDAMRESTVSAKAGKQYCYNNVYEAIAVETKDPSICPKTMQPDFCYQMLARALKDYTYCQRLSSDDSMQNCYKVYVIDNDTPENKEAICPLITNARFRELAGCL